MFTGIIESKGTISSIREDGTNLVFTIHSDISELLKIDQSVAHEGVCLTVTDVGPDFHVVTAIKETIDKTSMNNWRTGSHVNLERCMVNNGRFDGHIVQGHVDQVGIVSSIKNEDGSWLIQIDHGQSEHITVEKGSITVNGISLTCFNSSETGFSIAIIPYTFENTTVQDLKSGDQVNLEFDIIGKYVKKLLGSN